MQYGPSHRYVSGIYRRGVSEHRWVELAAQKALPWPQTARGRGTYQVWYDEDGVAIALAENIEDRILFLTSRFRPERI